ncbi:DUF2971 domain-containing protein [Sessilibacter corallicola]|uniref:DUF2971 domain-containing protein n=1 Tax=Sessilibacter corallicola TaxID=2904075 RepID=A0ABQ0AB94_9GAMM|nr:DUF2971 domain-containing protein [Sessilibacter corallicola]MCE2028275.1 DUF2971 domain-containing protein [Sessilibacter corallicola]
MIKEINKNLFTEKPTETFYHYTTLGGLMGIVESKMLRASDIRYMNDSTELKHSIALLKEEINRRIESGNENPQLLNQFSLWLSHRVVNGPMLFGASFRTNGNLLSQWRGYSTHGKGISLGFNPRYIAMCASFHGFKIGKCIYDPQTQRQLVGQVVDAVESLAKSSCGGSRTESKDYQSEVFEKVEGDLLTISAILKHPSFQEEQEWRIVSPVIPSSDGYPIQFREGLSMLVPFYAFDFTRGDSRQALELQHVYIGPTSNSELSMKSLSRYLDVHGSTPKDGITYCQIPYRQK